MFDTTFVEIDLVVDKILEVSQTGEFMSAKMVMKQRWVDNRLGWFSTFFVFLGRQFKLCW